MAQRGPAPAFAPCARLGEQRLELGHAGPHGDAGRRVGDELDAGQPERVRYEQPARPEAVAAPGDVVEDETRPPSAPHGDAVRAQRSHTILPLEARGQPAAAAELDGE